MSSNTNSGTIKNSGNKAAYIKKDSRPNLPNNNNDSSLSSASLDNISDQHNQALSSEKKVKKSNKNGATPNDAGAGIISKAESVKDMLEVSPNIPTAQQQSLSKRTKKMVSKRDQDTAKKFENLDKYNHLSGVTEWFHEQKYSLEQSGGAYVGKVDQAIQRKRQIILALPLVSHTWRPPRIDKLRYQCDEPLPKHNIEENESLNQLKLAVKEATCLVKDELKEEQVSVASIKRKKRSLSTDKYMMSKRIKVEDGELVPIESAKMEESKFEENPEVSFPKSKVPKFADQQPLQNPSQQPILAFDTDQVQNSQPFADYLELVEFMMTETLSSSAGVWLKGSSVGYHEKAMQLLHQYDYNYDLAKFHMLFPSVMAIPERREEILHSLSPKELSSIVEDAVIDLRGCKTKEAEDACKNIIQAVRNRISMDDLAYYQQVLKKLRVDVPAEVEREIARSREFSKIIKKRTGTYAPGTSQQVSNDKKMKIQELLDLQKEANESYYVITPEMQSLDDHVVKAQAWQARAEQMASQMVQLKTLQNFLQESRIIPVNFDQIYEQVKKRAADGQSLVDKVYSSFTKVTKTRTQLQQDQNFGNKAVQSQEASESKENLFRGLIKEADNLKIIHPEIKSLKDHIDQVDCWKARVQLFLLDHREQKQHKEVFKSLILEGSLFKFELKLTEDLQRHSEFIEWHEKVIFAYQKLNGAQSDNIEDQGPLTLEKLLEILSEGESKQFIREGIHEVIYLTQLCQKVTIKQKEIREILENIEEGSEKSPRLTQMKKLYLEISQLQIECDEIQNIQEIILNAELMVLKCEEYLQKEKEIKNAESKEQNPQILFDILAFKDQIKELNIATSAFSRLNLLVKPILIWINESRALIKSYHKSLELQQPFSHLELLQPHSFSDDDFDITDAEDLQINQEIQMGNTDFEILNSLLYLSQNEYRILSLTRDFEILNDLSIKVQSWNEKERLIFQEEDQHDFNQIDQIEKLLQEHIPVPNDKVTQLNKRLKILKWLRRLHEVTSAEKVKLKTIETLAKDSTHHDIQDDPVCKAHAEKLQEQLQQCRIWSEDYAVTDINSQKGILRLLDSGKSLTLNLDDYIDLRAFHHDMLEWRNITHAMLNGPRQPKYNIEFLKRHLEQAIVLDIGDHEQDILIQIQDLSQTWKVLAQRLLDSRYFAKLNFLEDNQAAQILYDENMEMKDIEVQQQSLPDQYCICRKPDDGMYFMIECDQCKEWFHGPCVGITEEESSLFSSYTCIGCARVIHRYDPLQPEEIIDENNSSSTGFNPSQLRAFSYSRRVSYEMYKKIIQEGQRIPIYFEELQSLSKFEKQYNSWLSNVELLLEEPLDSQSISEKKYFDQKDDNNSVSDSSSDQIINTKINQKEDGVLKEQEAMDEVTKSLHQAYLESEGFPFEVESELSDAIIRRLRERRWYWESMRAIKDFSGNELSNNAKSLLKKKLRGLISEFNVLILENEYQEEEDVHFQHMRHQVGQIELAISSQNFKYKKFRQKEEIIVAEAEEDVVIDISHEQQKE